MGRKQITASIVEEIDQLLSQRIEHGLIAARLGITEFVVEVIAGDDCDRSRKQPEQRSTAAVPRLYQFIDAATIRMIQRMHAAGILRQGQIAREAGVSPQIVEDVVVGKRRAVSCHRPHIFRDLDEKFLERSVQCKECQAMIEIIPCRACRARRSLASAPVNAS
jgi:hypothetical protein